MTVTPTKEDLIVALDFEGTSVVELVLGNPCSTPSHQGPGDGSEILTAAATRKSVRVNDDRLPVGIPLVTLTP